MVYLFSEAGIFKIKAELAVKTLGVYFITYKKKEFFFLAFLAKKMPSIKKHNYFDYLFIKKMSQGRALPGMGK